MKTKYQRDYEDQQLSDYKQIAKHWPIVLLTVAGIYLAILIVKIIL